MKTKVDIEPEWGEVLADFFADPRFIDLADFVRAEYLSKKIFPKPEDIFRAFWLTPFSQVKVVILGQDPYHNDGQAQGLCFSVPPDIPLPPSLKNIYKEIEVELGIKKDYTDGNLESWARQGVFLLNAILTVVAHCPASHRQRGWEDFTDTVIKAISDQREGVVFMLWGAYARSKKSLIDENKHLVLEAAHPSPLSAYSGWFGCGHFAKCNDYFRIHSKSLINW